MAFLVAAAPASPEVPITVTAHPWAPFISPMGEPYRAHNTSEDTLAAWFQKADRDHDGLLTAQEMVADADRFFAVLDLNHDGEIDPDEINHYEWEVAPEIQVNARTRRPPGQPAPPATLGDDQGEQTRDRRKQRGGEVDTSLGLHGALQGASRYGLLQIPEPVAAADADFNRGVSLQEFRQAALERFRLLDAAHAGKISLGQLQTLRQQLQIAGQGRNKDAGAPDMRIGNPVPRQP
jgi:Ca2+-binding EF-hand superfamily protein